MRWIVLAVVAAVVTAPVARGEGWEATPGPGSRIDVHVRKKGLFSGFAHDHHFEVTRWRATADLPGGAPAVRSIDVVLSADSLHDRQQRLSEEDRRKVDAQAAGPEVLDAAHHPRIEFRAGPVALEAAPGDGERLHGTAHGTLTLRGRDVPADVALTAERRADEWRVRGEARVRQSALGIEPFSGFGGTVGVKDVLEIEIALTLRRARRDGP